MSWWVERQKKDIFVKKRNQNNLISRAFFKIEEIDQKYNILKSNDFVLDLGAAPGGWSQYFLKKSKNIYAIDISSDFKLPDVKFFNKDVFENDWLEDLPDFDLIVSDMAPNFSGHKMVDYLQTVELCERALEIAIKKLKKSGILVMKIFEGVGFAEFLNNCKKTFNLVNCFKPQSSRKESKEIYLICRNENFIINSKIVKKNSKHH